MMRPSFSSALAAITQRETVVCHQNPVAMSVLN